MGWFEDSTFASETVQEIFVGSFGNKTFYAKWEANLLHLAGNGATSGSIDDMRVRADESGTLSKNEYIRTSYTFLVWATETNGRNAENKPETFTVEDWNLSQGKVYKKDYTFMGWYRFAEFNGEEITEITEIGRYYSLRRL